jgi:hypothetical protein
MELLDKKLHQAKINADYQKDRYWTLRLKVIAYLGGKCSECEESNVSNLEIHHDPPLVWSVKRRGFTRGLRSGEARIREWRLILAGKLEAKLLCKKHHIEIEHNGNTNALKNGGS